MHIYIRGSLDKENRKHLIEYLRNNYTLFKVDNGEWYFSKESSRVEVYRENFRVVCDVTDSVDYQVLRHTKVLQISGEFLLCQCKGDLDPVREHLESLPYLNKIAELLDDIKTLRYFTRHPPAGDSLLWLEIDARISVDKFEELKSLIKKITEEAKVWAVADSVAKG